MELDDQNICWSLPLNVHTFTTLLIGRFHLVKDTTAEKEFDTGI